MYIYTFRPLIGAAPRPLGTPGRGPPPAASAVCSAKLPEHIIMYYVGIYEHVLCYAML